MTTTPESTPGQEPYPKNTWTKKQWLVFCGIAALSGGVATGITHTDRKPVPRVVTQPSSPEAKKQLETVDWSTEDSQARIGYLAHTSLSDKEFAENPNKVVPVVNICLKLPGTNSGEKIVILNPVEDTASVEGHTIEIFGGILPLANRFDDGAKHFQVVAGTKIDGEFIDGEIGTMPVAGITQPTIRLRRTGIERDAATAPTNLTNGENVEYLAGMNASVPASLYDSPGLVSVLANDQAEILCPSNK